MVIKQFTIFAIFCILISLSHQNNNFNADESINNLLFLSNKKTELNNNNDVGPDHGKNFLFFAGMLKGLEIFNNVTHKNECLSIIPVIHDDWVDIYDRWRNVTDFKDMIEAIKYIKAKLEDIEKKKEEVRPDCKIMFEDIRNVLNRVLKFLIQPHQIKLIFEHFHQNMKDIKEKAHSVRENLKIKEWYKAGICYGDLFKFILFWNMPSELKMEIDSLINHHQNENFDFNRPPFKFE